MSVAGRSRKYRGVRTLPSEYNPYETPDTTVAMMNQSLQSRRGTSVGGGCHAYGGYWGG